MIVHTGTQVMEVFLLSFFPPDENRNIQNSTFRVVVRLIREERNIIDSK